MSPDTGKPGLGPGLAGLGTFHQGPPRAGGQPLLRPPRSRSDRGTAGDRDECEIGRKGPGRLDHHDALARNTYGMREMSLQRKIMEAALAIRLEREYSKEEILTYYMNRVYFGSGLYGVERAAQGYFMKSASELTLAEGAMLAGVIRGPSLLNPFRSMENAKDIQDEVLDRLVASDLVTSKEAEAAKSQSSPCARRTSASPRAVTRSRRSSTYSKTTSRPTSSKRRSAHPHHDRIGPATGRPERARRASLDDRADSWLRPRSAELAPRRHQHQLPPGIGCDPRQPHRWHRRPRRRRDFGESSFNRAFSAKRQVGSTFKPFVYAVAFHHAGLQPNTRISDDPVTIEAGRRKTATEPIAKSARRGRPVLSRNTMAVRVGQMAGTANIRDLAKALKFGEIPNSPIVSLGAFETTPVTITSAYSTFPTGGVNLAPFLISKIERADGMVLYQNEPSGRRIFPEGVAATVSNLLGKVLDEGTATDAGKTGIALRPTERPAPRTIITTPGSSATPTSSPRASGSGWTGRR